MKMGGSRAQLAILIMILAVFVKLTIAVGGTKAPLGNFLLNFVCFCEYVDRGIPNLQPFDQMTLHLASILELKWRPIVSIHCAAV